MSDTGLETIASLLDDPDENIAVASMAELLKHSDSLGDLPGKLQESDNPLMRKRIHQLQTVLTLRRRRRDFVRKLESGNFDLSDGLIEIHLQWFDNDPLPALQEKLDAFFASAADCHLDSLEGIAAYMHKCGFNAESETTLQPELYCIGTVLAEKTGAASLLCAVARAAADIPENFFIVRILSEFALSDGKSLLLPQRNWQIVPAPPQENLEFVDTATLLKFASAMLFSAAVNSDSFRYILTIGQTVSGCEDDSILKNMPYPYNRKRKR